MENKVKSFREYLNKEWNYIRNLEDVPVEYTRGRLAQLKLVSDEFLDVFGV